jgi:hypothetical protein
LPHRARGPAIIPSSSDFPEGFGRRPPFDEGGQAALILFNIAIY